MLRAEWSGRYSGWPLPAWVLAPLPPIGMTVADLGLATSNGTRPLSERSSQRVVRPEPARGSWLTGMANHGPGGVAQRERRRGLGSDVEGTVDMPPARCYRGLFLGTTRRIPGEGCPSTDHYDQDGRPGSPWNGRPSWRLRDALSGNGPARARDGWVGAKTRFPLGTGPAGDGVACPEEYSGLVPAGVTPFHGSQAFRRRVGRHLQMGYPHRCVNGGSHRDELPRRRPDPTDR